MFLVVGILFLSSRYVMDEEKIRGRGGRERRNRVNLLLLRTEDSHSLFDQTQRNLTYDLCLKGCPISSLLIMDV